jgi:hypothetical protein
MIESPQNIPPQAATAGERRFGGTWAKVEIFLGLFAVGFGLLLQNWSFGRPPAEIEWGLVIAGLVLFLLGGYLTLAWQRSHLYRSNIESTQRLLEEIHRLKNKG